VRFVYAVAGLDFALLD